MDANETRIAWLQGRALHDEAAKWIGTVQHNGQKLMPGCGFHAEKHGRLKRVIAAAGILKIDYERLEPAQLGRRRAETLERIGIKTVDRQPRARVAAVEHANQLLRLAQ